MSIYSAFLYIIFCMAVVFFVLALIWALIRLFTCGLKLFEKIVPKNKNQ